MAGHQLCLDWEYFSKTTFLQIFLISIHSSFRIWRKKNPRQFYIPEIMRRVQIGVYAHNTSKQQTYFCLLFYKNVIACNLTLYTCKNMAIMHMRTGRCLSPLWCKLHLCKVRQQLESLPRWEEKHPKTDGSNPSAYQKKGKEYSHVRF